MSKKKYLLILLALILVIVLISLFFPKNLEATIYGSISGEIIAEDTGEGLEDVEVVLCKRGTSGDFFLLDRKRTNKKGKAYFDMLKEGQYILLFITAPNSGYYADSGAEGINIPGRPIITLEKGKHIEVRRKALVGGSVLIKIKKRDGTKFTPPPEKSLKLLAVGVEWGFAELPDEPEESGEYFAIGIPPDMYRFEAEIEGHARKKLENIKIEKGKTTEIEFIIDFNDLTAIGGKITSSIDGGPISRAPIYVSKIINEERVHCAEVFSDETGYFSIVGLSEGKYLIYYNTPFGITPDIRKTIEIYVIQGKRTWIDLELDIPSKKKRKSQSKLS